MLPNAEANNENLPKLMNISYQDNVIYEDFGGKIQTAAEEQDEILNIVRAFVVYRISVLTL